MDNPILSCRAAKQRDLVDYLASLGHQPKKINGPDHWYLSPLREEKTPSFKVNKNFNVWYDHGTGKGGNLIDFGILYHQCTVRELLQKLTGTLSFQPLPPHPAPVANNHPVTPVTEERNRIKILSETSIVSAALIDYVTTRNIPLDLAREHCRQVDFDLYGKTITALGFANRSGGYELRNAHFKGSSSPKDITLIDNHTKEIAVFEGFFNFLSFKAINQHKQGPLTNCLILNSLALLEKSRPLMEQYKQIHLVLDNDTAGKKHTAQALSWSSKYIDRSDFYHLHKDLNEWLMEKKQAPRPSQRLGRHR